MFPITDTARCCQPETVKKILSHQFKSLTFYCVLDISVSSGCKLLLYPHENNEKFVLLMKNKNISFFFQTDNFSHSLPSSSEVKRYEPQKEQKLGSFSFGENFDDNFSVKIKLKY